MNNVKLLINVELFVIIVPVDKKVQHFVQVEMEPYIVVYFIIHSSIEVEINDIQVETVIRFVPLVFDVGENLKDYVGADSNRNEVVLEGVVQLFH